MSGHPIVFDFTEIQEQIQIKWHTYHTQACLETVLCLHKIHFLQNTNGLLNVLNFYSKDSGKIHFATKYQ